MLYFAFVIVYAIVDQVLSGDFNVGVLICNAAVLIFFSMVGVRFVRWNVRQIVNKSNDEIFYSGRYREMEKAEALAGLEDAVRNAVDNGQNQCSYWFPYDFSFQEKQEIRERAQKHLGLTLTGKLFEQEVSNRM